MMTKKSKKQTQVKTQSTTLSPLEEKVVRMRQGLRAPDELILEQVGQENADIAAELRAIEERALATVSARKTPAKSKIVQSLRRK